MLLLLLACTPEKTPTSPELLCGVEGLSAAEAVTYPRDAELTLAQLQARGTHNSYHQEPPDPLDASWEYSQPPLSDQLETYGVRQIELDLHLREDGVFEVFHVPSFDPLSSCPTFKACLQEVCTWSVGHREHVPLLIWLEAKDDLDGDNGYRSILGEYQGIEAEIRAVFAEDHLYTPDDWRRSAADVGSATRELGAPTLQETRGQVLFALLDSGEHRDSYLSESPDLQGRVLFPDTDDINQNFAALWKDAGPTETPDLLAAGLIVTSNVDSASDDPATNTASRDAALAGGVNFAASDFPAPNNDYWMELPEANPVRCNPITAPTDCVPEDLE